MIITAERFRFEKHKHWKPLLLLLRSNSLQVIIIIIHWETSEKSLETDRACKVLQSFCLPAVKTTAKPLGKRDFFATMREVFFTILTAVSGIRKTVVEISHKYKLGPADRKWTLDQIFLVLSRLHLFCNRFWVLPKANKYSSKRRHTKGLRERGEIIYRLAGKECTTKVFDGRDIFSSSAHARVVSYVTITEKQP